ncbi:MAG TPA: 2-phospho-L-lactate guanylyltransferase [Alphaproteobacteria bacterium]|nr:2-phospho-L-lactate guanylyltransferase [Alphaproteobacteria bacterium]
MSVPGIWAVVPAKDLAQAKRRLAGVLSAAERQGFARAMFEDVLDALVRAPNLAGGLVVTRDAALAALARGYGLRVIADLRHEGPNGAIALAAKTLAAQGAAGMIAIPADVPLVSAEDIASILAGISKGPSVTLAPAFADMGTNGIALAPPDAIPPCFGPQSFFRHQEVALKRGIEPHVLRLPNLGLDVDRPGDLARFIARPSATRSYRCLEASGALARLRHALSMSPDENASRGALQPREGNG